ncbi:MAG: hypothetical protein U5N86_01210 [Planctomycetota bacterium]|nr:hypothetical protein [Planctomycetota bacterium]
MLQQRLSGLTCPLILTVRNENSQPVEIPKSGLSLNLLLSDGQGFTRRLNISGAVRDGWKCTVPPRAEKMPGSLCEFTVDVFEQVGDLPEGEYEMRVLMDFDMDKGKVSLSSELATLVVPVRRDR